MKYFRCRLVPCFVLPLLLNPALALSAAPDYLQKMQSPAPVFAKAIALIIVLGMVLLALCLYHIRRKGGVVLWMQEHQQARHSPVVVINRSAISRTLSSYVVEVDGQRFWVLEKNQALVVNALPCEKSVTA